MKGEEIAVSRIFTLHSLLLLSPRVGFKLPSPGRRRGRNFGATRVFTP